eukprot:gb/GECH01000604.1/.p1 GENE.gb/GECH01000604.1/~~gb/GECH01000604.1/.p1  ORF type:complete len:603 (+),score=224.44 gb/GECH01000604.1/:1-1809(+)
MAKSKHNSKSSTQLSIDNNTTANSNNNNNNSQKINKPKRFGKKSSRRQIVDGGSLARETIQQVKAHEARKERWEEKKRQRQKRNKKLLNQNQIKKKNQEEEEEVNNNQTLWSQHGRKGFEQAEQLRSKWAVDESSSESEEENEEIMESDQDSEEETRMLIDDIAKEYNQDRLSHQIRTPIIKSKSKSSQQKNQKKFKQKVQSMGKQHIVAHSTQLPKSLFQRYIFYKPHNGSIPKQSLLKEEARVFSSTTEKHKSNNKENDNNSDSIETEKGSTLFATNLAIDADENSTSQVFSRFGEIKEVLYGTVGKRELQQVAKHFEHRISPFSDVAYGDPALTSRTAYIRFNSDKPTKRALAKPSWNNFEGESSYEIADDSSESDSSSTPSDNDSDQDSSSDSSSSEDDGNSNDMEIEFDEGVSGKSKKFKFKDTRNKMTSEQKRRMKNQKERAKLKKSADFHSVIQESSDQIPIGLERYVKQYLDYRPPVEKRSQRIDKLMGVFDKIRNQQHKKQLEEVNKPDEDGFITVLPPKGPMGTRSQQGVKGAAYTRKAEEKAKQGPKVQLDFYKFQRIARKKKELGELRQQFEEDKKRIQNMKEKRMFKPF